MLASVREDVVRCETVVAYHLMSGEVSTLEPISASAGDTDVTAGALIEVNAVAVEARPETVTTTGPSPGTTTSMLVSLQLVTVAAEPLNVTVDVPCAAPKLAPASVTLVPVRAGFGDTASTRGVR